MKFICAVEILIKVCAWFIVFEQRWVVLSRHILCYTRPRFLWLHSREKNLTLSRIEWGVVVVACVRVTINKEQRLALIYVCMFFFLNVPL